MLAQRRSTGGKICLPIYHSTSGNREESAFRSPGVHLSIVTREDLIQKVLRNLFGQSTVFSALHIETLDFHLLDKLAILLHEVDGSILLLGLEKDTAEDIININLKQFVLLVHCFLELIADLECIGDVVHVGVDHDGISVTVNDLQRIALGKLLCAAKNLAALERSQDSQRSSVEA
ncbi:hypothetical protein HG531_003169 [Fusarium graminearum]|nr:hypothetical protein HG531_003169 [Fusarium graminearum]